MANFSFDIPSLRRQSLFTDYGQPPPDMSGGYDWSAAPVDYSAGEMPAVGMNMPPPSVGPYETQPPAGMFGREYAPTLPGAQPSGPTMGAPPSQVAPPSVNTYGSGDSAKKLMETINQIYTPEYTDRDRLRGLMDAAPEREAPGWGRGLSAIALGIGSKTPEEGLKAQEAVMFAPHRRAMADWTAKADPFYKTADLENRSNINERTLAGNVATAQTNADRYEAQNEIARERNRITEIKAMADKAKAERWTVKVEGPDVYAYAPNGQSRRRIGDSSGMSTEDKINLEGAWKVAAAEKYAEGADRRAATAQTREFTDKEGNTWTLKPGSPAEQTNLPPGSTPAAAPRAGAGGGQLEKNRVEQDVLGNIWERDKESARHIRNDGNKFSMKPRPEVREDNPYWPGDQSVTQKDVDTWDAIKKEADPSYVPPKPKTAAAPAPPAAARPKPPAASFPEVKIKPESTTGLGPPNVPKVAAAPAPPVAKGRIQLYKNGKPAGTVSDNPEAVQEAIRRGFTVGV